MSSKMTFDDVEVFSSSSSKKLLRDITSWLDKHRNTVVDSVFFKSGNHLTIIIFYLNQQPQSDSHDFHFHNVRTIEDRLTQPQRLWR